MKATKNTKNLKSNKRVRRHAGEASPQKVRAAGQAQATEKWSWLALGRRANHRPPDRAAPAWRVDRRNKMNTSAFPRLRS